MLVNKEGHTVRSSARIALGLLCVLALLSCALLTGCKESDAIIERIYDQNSPNVDYDNPEKIYLPDDESPQEKDDLETRTDDSTEWESIVEADLPDSFGQEPNEPTRTPDFREQADSTTEAPRAQSGTGSKRSDASGQNAGKENEPEPIADDGGSKENGDRGTNDDEHGANEGIKPADPNDDTYLERVYDSTYGNTEDLPTDVRTIVATGELATITQICGEAGTLVGSSQDYLNREAIKDVFAGKGIGNVKAVWKGDGDTTTQTDAKAIIKANPDACLVYSGQLDADAERLIAQNCPDMKVITLPKPTSASNISVEFQAIARLLSDATEGASEDFAKRYSDFESELVSEAEQAHGGGVVTYASVDYNNNDSTQILKVGNPASVQLWTLYISGWDDDASVVAKYQGSTLFEDTGAAYTNTGWSWSPLSYYMSIGGVINNAAAYGPLSTQLVQPVLTLNENQVSYTWSKFCVDVDESRGGGSYSRYRAFYTLTNGRDAIEGGGTDPHNLHALGSDDFNTVIVKTPRIASALERARANENGLYTLYPYETTASESAYGRKHAGKRGESIVYSTVKGDAGYDIVVNPCGYVGSWTDGSIESPLEALWIASTFWGLDESKLKASIEEFYSTFYDGYVPNTDKILDGSYAEDE